MRVKTRSGLDAYPDISVLCGERQADDSWRIAVVDAADGAIDPTSIGCKLTLADVYEDIVFDA